MIHQAPSIRSTVAGLVLAVGLGGLAGGCGTGGTGSGTGAEAEKVPEGIVKMKAAMKERAAAKKGQPGAPGRATGGH